MNFKIKLITTYALIIVVTLAIVGIGVTVLLRHYADRLALERLDDSARPISVQAAALIRGNVTLLQLVENLQEQADANNIYIIWLDDSGNILRQLVPQGEPPLQVNQQQMPIGLTQPQTGEFTSAESRAYLYAAYPLTRSPVGLAKAQTFILATLRPPTAAVLAALTPPLLLAGIFALVVSLVLALWMVRSIYKPLSEVSAGVERISKGQYSYRIHSKDPGDIGKLAQAVDHMALEVESAQSKLRDFVADVSHELRSPLTAIQGFSQAILDGTASDDTTREKAVRIISDESRRLRHQVDELLDLSRLQSGRYKLNMTRIDLGEVIKRSVEVLTPSATDKSITIDVDIEPGLWINGDADRLEQVFNNLIDNAIKNSPSFARISLLARRENDYVIARVADQGAGIHPDALPHVFNRFYQVTGVRTGVGLGLAISREIILAHGGSIRVKSEPGLGAEFSISLALIL